MERLASRHPTNGCSPFAGNPASPRIQCAFGAGGGSAFEHTSFIQKQKIPTRQPHPRPSGPPAQSAPSQAFWPQAKTLAQGGSFRPELILIGFQKEKSQPIRLGFFFLERRGSNSLPPPWQGGALPDELRRGTLGILTNPPRLVNMFFPISDFFISRRPRRPPGDLQDAAVAFLHARGVELHRPALRPQAVFPPGSPPLPPRSPRRCGRDSPPSPSSAGASSSRAVRSRSGSAAAVVALTISCSWAGVF